jgi:hypothetical protein
MNRIEIITCILMGIFLINPRRACVWISNLFKRKHTFCSHVQFDEDNKPCICGTSIKELEQLTIRGRSLKRAEQEAFKRMKSQYPEYKGFLQYV